MLVAQISDLHVVAEGQQAYDRVDTAALLEQAIDAILALRPTPDWVIGTGDLVQGGSDAEYTRLRGILERLPMPFLPVAGNHDDRQNLRCAFANGELDFGPEPFVQYAVDLGDLRLVVIDTVTPGSDEPSFCKARADWLAAALKASDAPTLIAMHHPPFACGIDWLEPVDPTWAVRLISVLNGSPQVVRIIAGHVHRAISTTYMGIPASTAPSTAHQVFPGLEAGDEPLLSFEAPGFQLHRWEDGAFVSYTISTSGFGDVFSPVSEGR